MSYSNQLSYMSEDEHTIVELGLQMSNVEIFCVTECIGSPVNDNYRVEKEMAMLGDWFRVQVRGVIFHLAIKLTE